MLKKPLINNQIRALKIRVIDKDGKNLGILSLREAIEKAKRQGLDLIQVTHKVQPPVCKIGDYGKYLYSLQKKARKSKVRQGGEMKEMRLGFNISLHDMETKAGKVIEFLEKGDKVRIELILRGREKALQNFAKEKIEKFLEIIRKRVAIKIERELKKERRGLGLIISKE